jgi:hypothetical protein
MLTHDALVAVRDANGFRPLVLGQLDGAWVVASETCALDLIGATIVRHLDPGEMVVIRRGRLRSLRPFLKAARESFCIFEYVYFARPDSNFPGSNVYLFRKSLGRLLAQEHPARADFVVPLLDSGSAAALGYSEASGIPYETAIIRNHFVGRTFIEPAQSIRNFGVKVKHNAIRGVLEGKRVVVQGLGNVGYHTAKFCREQGAVIEGRRPAAPPCRGLGAPLPLRIEGGPRQRPDAQHLRDPIRLLGGGRSLPTHRFDLHQPKGPAASRWRIFSRRSSWPTACSATTRLRRWVSSSSTCVSRLRRCASPPVRNSSRHVDSLAAVTPWRRLTLSRSVPRKSSKTTETFRRADHRPVPARGEAEASAVALRAPAEAPASPGFCLDIPHSPCSKGLSNHFVRRGMLKRLGAPGSGPFYVRC